MKSKSCWLRIGAFACCFLLHLGFPLVAQADVWEVRREIRQGARDVYRSRRRATRRILNADSPREVRREIRRGIRDVGRARRRARRNVRGAIIDHYYD
jgi:hypothetical protein